MSLVTVDASRLVPMRYYGRNELILRSNPIINSTIEKVIVLTEHIHKLTRKNIEWNGLKEDLESVIERLTLSEEHNHLEKYKVEIINEVLIPYVDEIRGRTHFDKARFQQIRVRCSILIFYLYRTRY